MLRQSTEELSGLEEAGWIGVNFSSFRQVRETNSSSAIFPPVLHRYPGSTFMDHVLRYQDTPGVKMIVVLGEVSETSSLLPEQHPRVLLWEQLTWLPGC